MRDTDDQSIITLFEQRSEQAITESEQQYGTLCRSVARDITGSDEDAEECLNDAMLTAWNAIPPAKPRSFRSYLLRLVRNAALDRYRAANAEKRRSMHDSGSIEELADILPDSSNVVSEIEHREMLAAVTEFLRGLPQEQRNLFMRRYWYADDISTLAERFQMSKSHVTVTLTRLRKRLQKHLRKEGLL